MFSKRHKCGAEKVVIFSTFLLRRNRNVTKSNVVETGNSQIDRQELNAAVVGYAVTHVSGYLLLIRRVCISFGRIISSASVRSWNKKKTTLLTVCFKLSVRF